MSEYFENLSPIEQYNKYDRPALRILLITIALMFIFWSGFKLASDSHLLQGYEITPDRTVFLVYSAFFVSMWIVYFASKIGVSERIFKIQSLRRLLSSSCLNWTEFDPDDGATEELSKSFRRKSTATMQVMAILVAVSLLILEITGQFWREHEAVNEDFWITFSLSISAICSVASFISFIVSVDSLDTLFNKFCDNRTRATCLAFFYKSTINPKYVGMVSMIISVIFLIQVHSPFLGSVSTAIVVVVGYPFWFPHILDGRKKIENSILGWSVKNLFVFAFVLMPVIAHVYYQ